MSESMASWGDRSVHRARAQRTVSDVAIAADVAQTRIDQLLERLRRLEEISLPTDDEEAAARLVLREYLLDDLVRLWDDVTSLGSALRQSLRYLVDGAGSADSAAMADGAAQCGHAACEVFKRGGDVAEALAVSRARALGEDGELRGKVGVLGGADEAHDSPSVETPAGAGTAAAEVADTVGARPDTAAAPSDAAVSESGPNAEIPSGAITNHQEAEFASRGIATAAATVANTWAYLQDSQGDEGVAIGVLRIDLDALAEATEALLRSGYGRVREAGLPGVEWAPWARKNADERRGNELSGLIEDTREVADAVADAVLGLRDLLRMRSSGFDLRTHWYMARTAQSQLTALAVATGSFQHRARALLASIVEKP